MENGWKYCKSAFPGPFANGSVHGAWCYRTMQKDKMEKHDLFRTKAEQMTIY